MRCVDDSVGANPQEDDRINVDPGDVIVASRRRGAWLYGEKVRASQPYISPRLCSNRTSLVGHVVWCTDYVGEEVVVRS
jgi:hypothetical protein